MVRNYVLSKHMMATSKDDLEIDIKQLMDKQSYVLMQPTFSIAYDMFSSLEMILDTKYTVDSIYSLLQKDGAYNLRSFSSENTPSKNRIVLVVDSKHNKFFYDVKGDVNIRQVYYLSQIEEENVRYLVVEHIIRPEPGTHLVERCYRECFKDMHKALRYHRAKMDGYSLEKGAPNSGYRVFVVDKNDIVKSRWYTDNIEIARLVREYNLDVNDFRYMSNTDEIFMAIKSRAYDDIPEKERILINKSIYKSLRKYLSDDDLPFIEERLDCGDADQAEMAADQAILLAIANAEDKKTFDEIHSVLGYNTYRIGALTDEIYNANPDKGYILASKSGELEWYPACYFINEWEGARSNPYFGKFQLNENDTLLCLREFHPELFVKYFPSRAEMRKWDLAYRESVAEERREHPEMYFDKDSEGEGIVYGNWYYAGVRAKNAVNGITFHTNYGSHVFTEDECKRLLSGEEVVVEHYITKMDMETTIRGSLKDCSGMYDTEMIVEFVRTDINTGKQRAAINAELGITEPGLPPPPEDAG